MLLNNIVTSKYLFNLNNKDYQEISALKDIYVETEIKIRKCFVNFKKRQS